MRKKIIAAGIALLLFCAPVWAILGIGDIVHDPISYANALVMLAELIKSYEQLKAEYDLLVWNSKTVPVDMMSRYRTVSVPWYGLNLPNDRFQNLGDWLSAVNEGGSALGAYDKATLALETYGPKFSQLAPSEQVKTASEYASTELSDGTNIHALETVGALRGNAAAVDRAIQGLEQDSLSLDPLMNTEIGVLNKINAASIANIRGTRDTNRVLVSVLEQQIVESKKRRDVEVSEINTQIQRLEKGDEAKAEHVSTITESIRNFKWR